jgi:biotin-(acetyl-CoA carboxylase) ligase/methylase of polypeptide subunit release factors
MLAEAIFSLGEGRGRKMLEIGCGSGVIGTWANQRNWRCSACDINPYSVAATRALFSNYGFPPEMVREGGPGEGANSAWAGDENYDLIVWNLPYMSPPQNATELLGPLEESALLDLEKDGTDSLLLNSLQTIEPNSASISHTKTQHPTAADALNISASAQTQQTSFKGSRLLAKGGLILLVHSSNENGRRISGKWAKKGWASKIIHSTSFADGEELFVLALWRAFSEARVERVDSIDSTNRYLLEKGGRLGSRICAIQQTEGRGMSNNKWDTRDGSFACSWVLHDGMQTQFKPGQAQLLAGLATLKAINFLTDDTGGTKKEGVFKGIEIFQKWPNDIWSKRGKVAGILIEGRSDGSKQTIVLGIGVNLCEIVSGTSSANSKQNIAHEQKYPHDSLQNIFTKSVSRKELERTLNATLASYFENPPLQILPTEKENIIPQTDISFIAEKAQIFSNITHYLHHHSKPMINGVVVKPTDINSDGELVVTHKGESISIDSPSQLTWPHKSQP